LPISEEKNASIAPLRPKNQSIDRGDVVIWVGVDGLYLFERSID